MQIEQCSVSNSPWEVEMRIALVMVGALLVASCNDPQQSDAGEAYGDQSAATHEPSSGGAGDLPDGVYDCSYNSGGSLYGLGEITIAGNRYAGFSGGMRGTYSMNAEGGIAFSNGFEGTPDGFRVEGTVLKTSDYSGQPFIEMAIVSPSGNILTASCEQ